MPRIPHGHTPSALNLKRQFAKDIEPLATSLYETAGKWDTWKTRKVGSVDIKLVEVWDSTSDVFIHPSRHQFFPLNASQSPEDFHTFTLSMMAISDATRIGKDKRHVPQPASSSSRQIGHSKDFNRPDWAEAKTLIGYTSPGQFPGTNPNELIDWIIKKFGKNEACPSVYYQNGHATIDHKIPENNGWEKFPATLWRCLFFGNVPKACL